MTTLVIILITFVLLLAGTVAFLMCIILDYQQRERDHHTPVKPVEWEYTKERGWMQDAEFEHVKEG